MATFLLFCHVHLYFPTTHPFSSLSSSPSSGFRSSARTHLLFLIIIFIRVPLARPLPLQFVFIGNLNNWTLLLSRHPYSFATPRPAATLLSYHWHFANSSFIIARAPLSLSYSFVTPWLTLPWQTPSPYYFLALSLTCLQPALCYHRHLTKFKVFPLYRTVRCCVGASSPCVMN